MMEPSNKNLSIQAQCDYSFRLAFWSQGWISIQFKVDAFVWRAIYGTLYYVGARWNGSCDYRGVFCGSSSNSTFDAYNGLACHLCRNLAQVFPIYSIGCTYLLRNLGITQANQVWCTDIISIKRGFLYLIAVMDWSRRKWFSWRLSTTMDRVFVLMQ